MIVERTVAELSSVVRPKQYAMSADVTPQHERRQYSPPELHVCDPGRSLVIPPAVIRSLIVRPHVRENWAT